MTQTHLAGCGGFTIAFRRNDNDRRKPRQVLTGQLLGDPTPDRFERDAAARHKLAMAAAKTAPFIPPKVIAVVRALADGPMRFVELTAAMGVNPSSTSNRLSAARGAGLTNYDPKTKRHSLTDRGQQCLAELPQ